MSDLDDVIDVKVKSAGVDGEKAEQLKTVGWVSYLLHLIVAVAAVLPGANVGGRVAMNNSQAIGQ